MRGRERTDGSGTDVEGAQHVAPCLTIAARHRATAGC